MDYRAIALITTDKNTPSNYKFALTFAAYRHSSKLGFAKCSLSSEECQE